MIQPAQPTSRRRRLVIVTLTLTALAVTAVDWVGYAHPILLPVSLSARSEAYLCFYDGLVRVYHYRGDEPITVEYAGGNRRIVIRRGWDHGIFRRVQHAPSRRISHHAFVDTTFGPPPNTTGTTVHLSGIRTTGIVPVVMLLGYPVLAVLSDVFRRRKRRPGHCTCCDYDLTGNTTGICPECGQSRVCWSCGVHLGPSSGPCCPECGAPAQSGD